MDSKLACKLNYLAGQILLEAQVYFDHCVPLTTEQVQVIDRMKKLRNEISDLLLENMLVDLTKKGQK